MARPAQRTPNTPAHPMRIGPLQLRPLAADDMPQVLRIYTVSRGDDPLLTLWPQDQLAGFLQMQCHAQHQHYTQHYADAEFKLLELEGQVAGRLYWLWLPRELRLVEITVLPEFRGRGFATLLVQHLQAMAAARNLPLALNVACTNHRALALYQRLGFALGDNDGMYYEMHWVPSSTIQTGPYCNTPVNTTQQPSNHAMRGDPAALLH
jgi:ribosomal protein S18 acetylase RimI-like enzyme